MLSPVAWVPATRFAAPVVGSEVVLPADLVERFVARARAARLTLVVAQGGAGKTTLVAAAASRIGPAVAWLHLDAADDEPRPLLELIVLALDRAVPGACPTALDVVTAGHPLEPRRLVGVLVNDLVASGCEVALVVDDIHHVSNTDALAALDDLLRHAPPNLRVVATGRRAPGLRLSRLRAAGALAEIGADDLRFDTARAEALLVERLGLDVDPRRIDDLVRATNGWVAALVLSATALGGADGERFGTPEALDDYLADELLASEPEDVRQFLLFTSVLDVLDAEACRAVTGRDDADELLAGVRRRLRLLVDDLGGSWRYHDLLRDHLRSSLRRDAASWRLAHERAAAASPPGPERIEHLLTAGDHHGAAEEITTSIRRGPVSSAIAARVVGWAERLDPDVRAAHPWVDLTVAAALADQGSRDLATRLLDAVVSRAPEADFELRWLALRFQVLVTRDYARFGAALRAMEADDRYPTLPASSRVEQAIGAAWAALWSGDPATARRRVEEATALTRRTRDLGAAESLAVHYSVGLTAWPGGTDALAAHGRWASQALGAESASVRVGAQLQVASAELVTGTGPGVVGLTPGELELSSTVPYWAMTLSWLRAVRARVAGDPAGAAASIVGTGTPLAAASGAAAELQVALAPLAASALRELGRADAVERIEREVALAEAPDRRLHDLAVDLVAAEAAWAAGDGAGAEAALRDLIGRSAAVEAVVMLEASGELAVLLAESGRPDEAARVLEPLLDRVAPTGAWARVAQSGHGLVPVLRSVRGGQRAAAASVLGLLAVVAPLEPRAVPGSPEVLTGREVEVLRELATGASNQAIGARLHLSENTVKTHVKRVLAKLGAPSRTAAVARARELALL